MAFDFSTVYVRDVNQRMVRKALVELMGESERVLTNERGIDPTPESSSACKRVRSFAVMPEKDGWVAILEDGHARDDSGLAEGLSELLQAETMHFAYSDDIGEWSFVKYWEGQPLEAGGSDDEDFDALALEFVDAQSLPYFGVYYEEVAASLGSEVAALASATMVGAILPDIPIGTEVLTFQRPGKPLPR